MGRRLALLVQGFGRLKQQIRERAGSGLPVQQVMEHVIHIKTVPPAVGQQFQRQGSGVHVTGLGTQNNPPFPARAHPPVREHPPGRDHHESALPGREVRAHEPQGLQEQPEGQGAQDPCPPGEGLRGRRLFLRGGGGRRLGGLRSRGGQDHQEAGYPDQGEQVHVHQDRVADVHGSQDEDGPEAEAPDIKPEGDHQALGQGHITQGERDPERDRDAPGECMHGAVEGQVLEGGAARPRRPPEDQLVHPREKIDRELEADDEPGVGAVQGRVRLPQPRFQAGFGARPAVARAEGRAEGVHQEHVMDPNVRGRAKDTGQGAHGDHADADPEPDRKLQPAMAPPQEEGHREGGGQQEEPGHRPAAGQVCHHAEVGIKGFVAREHQPGGAAQERRHPLVQGLVDPEEVDHIPKIGQAEAGLGQGVETVGRPVAEFRHRSLRPGAAAGDQGKENHSMLNKFPPPPV